MNCEEFFDTIRDESLTFNELLEIIKTSPYDMTTEDQPCCMLQYFGCINDSDTPIEDAFEVANAFKNRLGLFVISRESSYCECEFWTIMDDFDSNENEQGSFWNGLLRHAFRKTGFLYAREVHPKYLLQAYSHNKLYGNTFANGEPIELDEYKEYPEELFEELAQHLYHPDRIEKWLKANPGKEVDDYLN